MAPKYLNHFSSLAHPFTLGLKMEWTKCTPKLLDAFVMLIYNVNLSADMDMWRVKTTVLVHKQMCL